MNHKYQLKMLVQNMTQVKPRSPAITQRLIEHDLTRLNGLTIPYCSSTGQMGKTNQVQYSQHPTSTRHRGRLSTQVLKPVLNQSCHFFSEHSFVPRTAPLFGLHDDGCRIFHQVTYSQTFLGFLLASQCNRIEMLTGPLACLCLSSFDLVDKNQDSQSGTWSLMLLFPGCK